MSGMYARSRAYAARNYDMKDVESGRMMAVLCYFPVSPVNLVISIVCLVQRNNAFSLYHAKQSLALIIAMFVLFVLAFIAVVLSALGDVSQGLTALGILAYVVLGVSSFVLAILGVVNAAGGKYKPLPFVAGLADQMFGGIGKL